MTATLNSHQQQGDSGHETLVSGDDDDSPTPTAAVERASSEVIYSTINNTPSALGPSSFARSRRSLAEPPNNGAAGGHIYEDIDQYHSQPPMIAPVSGVPNLKNKAVIRPIAFRPTPVNGKMSNASTPTNGPPPPPPNSFRPINAATPTSSSGQSYSIGGPVVVNAGRSLAGVQQGNGNTEGFAPGHPLVKEGRRHYGSSQELHVSQPAPPAAFNKFNSLDRRALARRGQQQQQAQQSGGAFGPNSHLKLIPGSSGAESLPPSTGGSFKDSPERRHSSYDRSRYRPLNHYHGKDRLSAMNINGLPDPASGSTSLIVTGRHQQYASQESLHRGANNTPGARNSGAGTPQFQNLSGAVRANPRNGSLTNVHHHFGHNHNPTSSTITINGANNYGSIHRSASGTSLLQQHHHHNHNHNHHHHHPHHQHPHHANPAQHSSSASSSSSSGCSSGDGSGGNNSTSLQQQTPSPSDSAVGDLESMLKEKDTEINYLRETMEQNEQVIFKVYEEKEKMWERELRKIKGLYDNRMKASQQKASKMEQALTNQTYQLQNDKRRLDQEVEEIRKEMEGHRRENERLKQELNSLRKSLDSSTTGGDSRSPSTSSSSSAPDSEDRDRVLLETRVQLNELKMELERKDVALKEAHLGQRSLQNEINSLKGIIDDEGKKGGDAEDEDENHEAAKETIIARDREIAKLRQELEKATEKSKGLKHEADRFLETFETEKAMWLDEKEKVIRYQKQLQLNYVQMYKRNKTLETEMEALNRKLEDQTKAASAAQSEAAEAKKALAESGSKKSKETGSGAKVKKSNSVRAKFFKMSLHSESHC